MSRGSGNSAVGATSVDKALEICEVLGTTPAGMSLTELARLLKQPRPTVHRLLALLKRRGYVRQDEETQRYSLTLKMLDLCFRQLGRSELRLHAYPVMREYVLRSGQRAFIAVPALGEVTYLWSTGPDDIAMRTVYGREMPAHCSIYFDRTSASRRLSCLRLSQPGDLRDSEARVVRLGTAGATDSQQRMLCTCAPVIDYSGREVARVGLFRHAPGEMPSVGDDHSRDAWELARHISMRLGYLPAAALTGAA